MDRRAIEEWVTSYVEPVGRMEVAHVRPWSTVLRVPVSGGAVWFKACGAVQAFEAGLTARLYRRWPDRVSQVLAVDEGRAWLLLADAGEPVRVRGNRPEHWLRALPEYAELQRGETRTVPDHLAHGVPDLRVDRLPGRFHVLLRPELPLRDDERLRLAMFEPRFVDLCADLAERQIPPSIQHDDLHLNNLFVEGDRLRVLDWGDSSISHPFASLVVTFRFLEESNGMPPDDPWFPRLRDAYLEPWGQNLEDTLGVALVVGAFAHAIACVRQRDHLDTADHESYDEDFRIVVSRALAVTIRDS